ncbi:MAG: chitinase [Clostridiales bacterium]|nr:chitinase [Clostridiales bacterium]
MFLCAYCTANTLDRVTADDAARLDLINIAFGTIRDGLLWYPRVTETKAELDRIRAAHPGIKILLSIGGWGAGGFSTMAKTPKGIAAFTASCMTVADALALDGLDIDWEYPTIGSAGIDHAPEDRENFTALLQSLREALGPDRMLTIAAGAGKYMIEAIEIPKIVPLLDYFSLMTYDMAGGWTPACHHTALYPTGHPDVHNMCVDAAVRIFGEAGVPQEKLVIGAAFYSRRWTHIPAGDNLGFGERCYDPADKESGLWGPGYTEIAEKLIDPTSPESKGWRLVRDDVAHARWLYNPEKEEFLSFDDEESVAEKVRYARDKGLAGVMYWEHSCDPSRRLLRAMSEECR